RSRLGSDGGGIHRVYQERPAATDVSILALHTSVVSGVTGFLSDVAERVGLPPPFKKYAYDTMKIIHQAHGAKTNELVVSLEDDDDLILRSGQTLREAGVVHETELALFCDADYRQYKKDPVSAW
ncbi:unnamed protein product, partial [Staurois parvus]